MLIDFSSVGFGYGDNLIFSDVTFAVDEGDRIGLVGENGAGKTTLIKLMLGELTKDEGVISRKLGLRLGYLEQNGGYDGQGTVYDEMRAVFKEELAAVERLEEFSKKLAECEYGSAEYSVLSAKVEAAQKYVAANDCYGVDVKIKTVLNGMGFADFYGRTISGMSGGEKTRLKLARLLLEEPDLLVLDEPTNHLDIKTLFWLEGYLSSFKGAIFVVSHDRYFLDKTVSSILEIENKRLSSFKGNYTKYKVLKAERYALAVKEYERQREEIKKLQTYVDKNIVRATTARSAQSRVKQLERMEIMEKPFTPPKPPKFDFTYSQPPAERVLKIENLNLEIGGKSLIVGGQCEIMRGEKVAIVGDNGAGKSTFLKEIVKGVNPAIERGRFVSFAFYDQENANLNPDGTVLEELWGRHVAYSQTEARASLARCGLFPEDMEKKVSSLSGGERAKLALCVFENVRGNVLLLDEPTNHLDLPARESLEEALQKFDGTVIFVSHDRYFISAIADGVLEIENKRLTRYDGGYEGYKKAKKEEERAAALAEENARKEQYKNRKEAAYRSGKARAEEARKKALIKSIEADISRGEAREEELNASLSLPEIIADYARLKAVTDELAAVREKLDKLYSEYGELID